MREYNQGRYIVLEGIDGAGTTTQSELLVERLRDEGFPAVFTFEPSDGEIGKLIRRFLNKEMSFTEETMALLFAADRVDHIDKVISKHMLEGQIVVSDRYLLSSLSYQSLNVDVDFIEQVNKFHVKPELTLLLDIEPNIASKRKIGDNNEHYEKISIQEKVRENYLKFAKKYSNEHNVKIIDGNRDKELIANEIYHEVLKVL